MQSTSLHITIYIWWKFEDLPRGLIRNGLQRRAYITLAIRHSPTSLTDDKSSILHLNNEEGGDMKQIKMCIAETFFLSRTIFTTLGPLLNSDKNLTYPSFKIIIKSIMISEVVYYDISMIFWFSVILFPTWYDKNV